MNKDEILAKSREEGKDEGFADASNRGYGIGMVAFCIVFIFIIFFNLFNGKPNHAPMAMFCAFFAAEAYPKYKFTKSKLYLVTAISNSIACVAFLINMIISTLG